jgi:hypothetical protein
MLLGCERVDELRHYQAIKLKQPEPPPFEEPEPVDGISAAIIVPPGADAAWFFKLSGPVAAVGAQADAFEKFVASVHFVDDAPKYDVPADWKPQGPGPMRYETFEIPGDVPIELAVSTLPGPGDDNTSFLLANINRWRGQLGLRQIGPEHLAGMTRELPLADGTATLVNLVGKLKQAGMGSQVAPFSGAGDGK